MAESIPPSEILGIVGHEFGHIVTRRRFALEATLVMGLVMGFAFLLSLHSVPIIYEVAEIALALLMLSFISWRAERRADLEGARGAGPEGLISVLELLKSKTKRDEGSETHPPCADRIKKLMKMLDEENVDEETNEI